MSIELEDSGHVGPETIINHIKTIFPVLQSKQNKKGTHFSDLDDLSKNLSTLIKKIPPPTQNLSENLLQMQNYRTLQEHRVHQRITNTKPIDFFAEVGKHNPEMLKIMNQNHDPNIILDKIVDESNQRISNLKNLHKTIPFEETTPEKIDNLHNADYEDDSDSLSLLDMKDYKKPFSDPTLIFENLGEETHQTQRSSKLVYFTKKGKLVFGFDKVENLMDPPFLEEEAHDCNSKDLSKELSINFESNLSNFKLIS